MGIRVTKQLGWVYKGELDLSKIEGIKLNDFMKNPDFKKDDLLRMDTSFPGVKEKNIAISDCIREITDWKDDDEFTAFTIFTPPIPIVNENWSRYDDIMDYLENSSARTKIKYIHRDLFPYSGKYAITSSLKTLTQFEQDRIRLFGTIPVERWEPQIKEQMEQLGLDLTLPLHNQMHQAAPRIIEEFFKLLSDESYLVLRPAIVTHWG